MLGLEDTGISKPKTQQQPQTVGYKDIQHLAFGFRHIVEIDHLHGLVNLKKLQLDNNCLTKIENLDHLVCKPFTPHLARQDVHTMSCLWARLQVNLTWLDLSFNNISKLEGLSKLTKLTDLSLFSNKLERIENIQTLQELIVLSVGNTACMPSSLLHVQTMCMTNLSGLAFGCVPARSLCLHCCHSLQRMSLPGVCSFCWG